MNHTIRHLEQSVIYDSDKNVKKIKLGGKSKSKNNRIKRINVNEFNFSF